MWSNNGFGTWRFEEGRCSLEQSDATQRVATNWIGGNYEVRS
jgi:hypothetical protein